MPQDNDKFILVAHPVCDDISEKEMLAALPPDVRRPITKVVTLDSQRLPFAALDSVNWLEAQRKETEAFSTKLKPILDQNPDYNVCYFGIEPIPIGILAGYLYGTSKASSVFQKNHQTHEWEGSTPPKPPIKKFAEVCHDLKEIIQSEGHAIIRVSVSYNVHREQTLAVVPHPLAEIDIRIPKENPDSTQNSEALESVGAAFREALDTIKHFRPNVTLIHVFAAVPAGVSFRLGTKISPTIHPDIMTYQFFNKGGEAKYTPAFALRIAPAPEFHISDEKRKELGKIRELWEKQVRILEPFANKFEDTSINNAPRWLASIFPEAAKTMTNASVVPSLSLLKDTEIPQSCVGARIASSEEGFRYDIKTREWLLSDELLFAFAKQFTTTAELERAGRLLILHEGVHLADHRLTEATAPRIGRFPKLLEAADYHADLWGIFHEYRFARDVLGSRDDHRPLFSEIIGAAIRSFWAFDDIGNDLREIQVRRIQRYLNWYWQLLYVESSKSETASVQQLAEKPYLEIAGPEVRAVGERVFFPLDGNYGRCELCVMHQNKIHRFPDGNASRISDIFEGFRRRSDPLIRTALKGVFDQVVTHR